MRRTAFFILASLAIMLPVGCETKSSTSKPADQKVANAKEKIEEAGKATVDAAKAKRDEYAREMRQKLDELDAKYKILEKRAAESKDDAKKDMDAKVKVAKAKRDLAAKKLEELKEAGHDRWEKLRDGVENAFEDLKKSFE